MDSIYLLLADFALQAAVIILAAVLPVGLYYVRKGVNAFSTRTGIVLDEKHAQSLERAWENGVEWARSRAETITPEQVVEYVREFNPGDLAHFRDKGLLATEAALRERATAAIQKYAVERATRAVVDRLTR